METREAEMDPAIAASELRRALLGAIEQAVKSEVLRFQNAHPPNRPWVLDARPGCPPLRGRIDQVLDAITQVLVRPVDRDHFASFYDRVGLAVLGLDRD
jgi:hypothetical protein